MFIQAPPQVPDLYLADDALRAELERRVPKQRLAQQQGVLLSLGQDTAGRLSALACAAHASPPLHVPFDAWGRRVDRIQTSPAWRELKDYAAQKALVAVAYQEHGGHHRSIQAARLYLYSASSAFFSCPLAMTDAAARVLIDHAEPALRERLLPKLLSTDPAQFITSGQWMTERSGGSDVGGTETVARPVGQSQTHYTLHGPKWFTSATTSEMALTLARIDPDIAGSRGLTLFAVDVQRDDDGALIGIEVGRLKDKLGTRALPTAELVLRGLRATRVGPVGRGVASIATMLNITRYYNVVSSASLMARSVFLARDYASRRRAFGKTLDQHPLHQATLAELEAKLHGGLSMAMEVAQELGRVEAGSATLQQRTQLRALIPLAKLTLGKQALEVCSESLECFGGAGYVEDTGLPRMLRDAQVFSIWEGTTNVLALDLLRAQARDGAFSALLESLTSRARALDTGLDAGARQALVQVLERVDSLTSSLTGDRAGQEREARRVALATGYAAQAVFVGETAAQDRPSRARFSLLVRAYLMAPLA